MDKEQQRTAAQMRALGEMIRSGLAKRRAVNPKHLEAARAVVRGRWQQEKSQGVGQPQQGVVTKSEQTKSSPQRQAPEQEKKKSHPQEKKKGQDHGHSR